MDSHPDWDLLALVRSCSSTTTTATTTATTSVKPSPSLSIPHPPTLVPQQEQICFTTAVTAPVTSTCSASSVLFGFSSPLATTSFISRGQQELPLSCTTTTTAATTTTTTAFNNGGNNGANCFQSFSCSSLSSPVSSSSAIITAQEERQRQMRRVVRPSQVIFGASSANFTTSKGGATSQGQRTKKRKSLMKKVCNVPAEGLSSDMWAWRKYGQKPIKGSPHPRGYYRCSSSKGCMARKQVERNRSDPKMFIVTYTSEHNHPIPTHRNSLAGSTRQKALNSTGTPPEQPTCSSPSTTNLSPMNASSESMTKGKNLIKYEEDNDMGVGVLSDLMLKDDFFVGFEQIDGGSDDSDSFCDHFSPSSDISWLDNGRTTCTPTTTAGRG